MSDVIKVIIADDHLLVREGLKKIIAEEAMDIKIVNEASSAAELLEILTEGLPDLVILDITLPGRSGLDTLKDLQSLYPKLAVLILSIHPEHRYAVRVIKSGAAGYLTKAVVSDELITAIRTIVSKRKRYISPAVADQLAQQLNVNIDGPLHSCLSNREYEVFCMIATGKKISTIAEELSLSDQTIHTYRARIKEKMNLKSNVDITRYAIKNKLID